MRDQAAILAAYGQARWLQQRFANRAALEAWQERQVQKLLKRVLPLSGFYQRQFATLSPTEWRQAPVVDKTDLMAHFDRWNTVGIGLEEAMAVALRAEESRDFSPMMGEIAVGLSSGTSGHRGVFLVSRAERLAWSGNILAKVLPDCWKRPERIAFFLRANNHLYQSLGTGHRIRFEYFDLREPIASALGRLNEYQPTVLAGPPSLLRMLADARQGGALGIAPTTIVSVAEVLEPLDAAWIQAEFGQPVHQVYQCTEGFLAATCRLGTLHLNEDGVVVEKEYLDQPLGKFVPVITDFRRSTQPIIRYRLNDVLTEQREGCACGSVFTSLASVEGRCDDLFYLPGLQHGQWVPVFPDFIRRALLLSCEDIAEYCAVQTAPQKVEIRLRLIRGHRWAVEERVRASFRALCQQQRCQMPEIDFPPYVLSHTPGSKLRRIQRTFDPQGQGVLR